VTVDSTNQPQPLPVQAECIAADLRAIPRWVTWRYVRGDGKWEKVPLSGTSGRRGDVNDPATWMSFQMALAHYRQHALSGIGFVFTRDDDLCGVDLDDCRDPASGDLQPWAWDIIRQFDTYTEVSPSRTGVKIFLRGRVPGGKSRKSQKIEVYPRWHYFTVTGLRVEGTLPTVETRQEALDWLCCLLLPSPGESAGNGGPLPEFGHLSDDELIQLAGRAKNGDKVRRLMAGDTTGYASPSEADLALCSLLAFWAGPDPDRVEELFNRSKLAERKKWQRRGDYVQWTIEKAMSRRAFYSPTPSTSEEVVTPGPTPLALPGESMSTRILQDSQDYQDSQDMQETPGLVSTRAEGAPPPSPRSSQDVIQIAIELAETQGGSPDWQVMFVLARRLRSKLAGKWHEDLFQQAVVTFCERAQCPAEDYWYAFQSCWHKAKLAEGEDVVEWAVNMAKQQPVMVADSPLNEKYALVGSVAYHFGEFRKPKPFWFPVKELASLLKATERTVYRVIELLEQRKVIRCVNADYSFTKHRAKEFIYLGPGPANTANPAA
jgi:putative DNA primase/helicase